MKSKTIFVDSDAFVALAKEDDTNHDKAVKVFQKYLNQPVQFITSNFVFSETVTVLSMRVSHNAAIEFIKHLKSPENTFVIKRVDEAIEERAIDIFTIQKSKNTSFVDCTNMAFTQEGFADLIFSFDEVYRKNKIPTV